MPNKNTDFQKTKKKLTLIFTSILFFLSLILGSIFFSFKHYNNINTEKRILQARLSKIQKTFISPENFAKKYKPLKNSLQNIFDFKNKQHKKRLVPAKPPIKIKNTLIINRNLKNKSNYTILFEKFDNNIDLEMVNTILQKENIPNILVKKGYTIAKLNIKNNNPIEIYIFSKNIYPFSSYLIDLLQFLFITIFFSGIFYYIGYKFVEYNLKPVEKNIEEMQNFIHNAGHELKTPLAIAHSNLQLIKHTKTYEADLIKEGILEIEKINKLIESLISLSEISTLDKSTNLNLKEEIQEIIKPYKEKIKLKQLNLQINTDGNPLLKCNKQHFYILVSNLLSNSIKYTNPQGNIQISLQEKTLTIKDSGIGIKKENTQKIFDRFFQEKESRNSKGFGIGLSLVKKIIHIYNWKIELKSQIGKGTQIQIFF